MSGDDRPIPIPDEGTHVRITCDRASISAILPVRQAKNASTYVATVANQAQSELQLAAFIRDQIDGRDIVAEAALSEAFLGHAEDVASKMALFALGLLAKRAELAMRLDEVLFQGQAIIDVRITELSVDVSITQSARKEDTGFVFRDAQDKPTFH